MEVNAFEVLASVPDDPDTGRFLGQSRYLKLEIPPNAEGCRRFLHGVAIKETLTGDVVMEDCVEMTTSTVLRYCGIVKVSRACILKFIYPKDFFVSKYNTTEHEK
ncbi:GL16382 [Drosophila persimilis]|uniref:GL16382 n=1 Tax=Drosophila persimilis TaxID=7234 RepID=B4GWR8_DROPE|nr:uncharacterized protein LOC6597887 [Drosophila persimilis]EDW27152.1 GL16382 [Drosophila persimilis]